MSKRVDRIAPMNVGTMGGLVIPVHHAAMHSSASGYGVADGERAPGGMLVRVLSSAVLLCCTAVGFGFADEPGTETRNGVEVLRVASPERSEYFTPGTEELLPPLTADYTHDTGHNLGNFGNGVVIKGQPWSLLASFNDSDGQAVYADFLSAMGFSVDDPSLVWPTDANGDPVEYLGASSISELFGSYVSRAFAASFRNRHDDGSAHSTGFQGYYGYPRVGATQDVRIPPNYPPLTHDVWASNSVLVPGSIAGVQRAIYSERAALGGQMDLITGQPLIREVDLEIPFGGAVFRRIRTYSEASSVGMQAHNWSDKGFWARSWSAGWHGSGWMSSDAPLFLIDAGFAQTMTIPRDGRASEPRCIFVLDAHHSIPFVRRVSPAQSGPGNADGYNVDYVAPEWFDALLLHSGGEWDGDNHRWRVYPTEFRVILNKRSVIYTIKPYYEDVDPAEHKLPVVDNGTFRTGDDTNSGVPYYGLVQEVRDRAGNRVEFHYAGGHRPFDGPIATYEYLSPDDPDVMLQGDSYRSVRQRGWYKGMIDHVKLYEAGREDASWTLLYTYRAFAAQRERQRDWNFWDYKSFAPALHSVLAYEEDLATGSINRDLILKNHEIPDIDCEPPPPGPDGGWTVDGGGLGPDPAGGSSAAIDHMPHGNDTSPRVGGVDNPPFVELLLDDDTSPCSTRITPRPLSGSYANQFDYQDAAIGPVGEGADTSGWSVLPGEWVHCVRYAYADPPQYNGLAPDHPAAYTLGEDFTRYASGPHVLPQTSGQMRGYTPREWAQETYLLKVVHSEKEAQSSSIATRDRYWMYRYQDAVGSGQATTPSRYVVWSEWSDWQGPDVTQTPLRRMSYRYDPAAVDHITPKTTWDTSHASKNAYVNHLIGIPVDQLVPSSGDGMLPLREAATSAFLRWSEPYKLGVSEPVYPGSWAAFDGDLPDQGGSVSQFQSELRENYLGAVSSDDCPDLAISQAPAARTGFLPEGVALLVTKDGSGNTRWRRVYRFLTTPENEQDWRTIDSVANPLGVAPGGNHDGFGRGPEIVLPNIRFGFEGPGATQALYQYPYRFAIGDIDDYEYSESDCYATIPRKDPMWWTVIDEYESLEGALSECSSLAHDSSNGTSSPWMSRRVVSMNSAGLILSDRTWEEGGGVSSPPAILDAYVYDEYLRLTMHLSRGWGSALVNNDNEGENGLVRILTYDEPTSTDLGDGEIRTEVPREVKDVWLNKGCRTPLDPSHPGFDPNGWDAGEIHVSELRYYRDEFDGLPEYQAGQLYSQTVFDLLGNPDLGTVEHRIEFWEPERGSDGELLDPGFDVDNPPIKWEINAGALFQRDPTKPYVRPVDMTFYDRQGRLVWRVYGSMEGIIDPALAGSVNSDVVFAVGEHDELFLDYRQYDEAGRVYFEVEDIDIPAVITDPSEPDGGIQSTTAFNIHDIRFPASGLQQEWPIDEEDDHGVLFIEHIQAADDGIKDDLEAFWQRLNDDIFGLLNGLHRKAHAAPLDAVTYREFNRFGLSKVVYPSGVRDLYDYDLESDYLNEFKAMGVEFNGEKWGFAGQQLYDSSFDGSRFVEQAQAVMDDLLADQWDGDPYDLESGIFEDYRLRVIARVEPSYDSSGRMSGMSVLDEDAPSDVQPIKQSVAYDGWGNILRSQDADGLITANTYDKFGRKHKTFQGSKDRHEIWGTADIGEDDDDMFLVDKVHYGLGTNDAGEVTHKWSFRQKSPTQYGIDWDEPSEGDWAGHSSYFTAGGSGSEETSSGLLETYEYDWRMRKVITRYRGIDPGQSNTSVFREERVFLDNADRVRFVAVYEGLASADAPHPDIPPGMDLPEGADFFENNAAANLLSLQETRYNGAGQTVEQLRYDPGSPDPSHPGYFVVHNFTDHGNRPTWSRDSGQRITRNVYDARGRLAWTSTFAGEIELSRSENVYGPAGTVDVMVHSERIDTAGAPSDSFEQASKRTSISYQWFDRNKRLIASADFGAMVDHPLDELPERPVSAPVRLLELEGPTPDGDPNDPDPPPPSGTADVAPTRKLVGIAYPVEWFDSDGNALARVTASWYGPIGQKNAALTLQSAEKVGGDVVELSYTIDRFEHNNYGQMVLEHRYGYEVLSSEVDADIEGSGVFLGGTAYGYDVEGWVEPGSGDAPKIFPGTKVRRITPLTEMHGAAIAYDPDKRRHWVDWDTLSGPSPTTVIEYSAPVIEPDFELPSFVLHPDPTDPYMFPIDSADWGHLGVSNRPDLVKAVHLPNALSGADGEGLAYSMFYFYYADGLPAIRLDSRGIALRYIYDRSGNLVRLESDDTNLPLIDSLGMTDEQLPANAIEYDYDGLDRLVRAATVRDYADGTRRVDTESVIEYDRLGAMLKEYQSRSGGVDTATTRFVGYGWERDYAQVDYSGGLELRDNIDRIASITYPARVGTHDGGGHTPRTLHFGYGDEGSVSDLLGRVETLTASGGPVGSPLTEVARYHYSGVDRLDLVQLGRPPNGSDGDHILRDERAFDGFGRVAERTVTGWGGSAGYQPVMSSRFGYDLAGRRIYERLTQLDLSVGEPRDNTHSAFYEHDHAGRLVGERYGALKSNGFDGIDHAASPAPRVQAYGLDMLNRRVGTASDPGIKVWEDLNQNGQVDANEITLSHDHVVDKRSVLKGLDDGSSVTPVGLDPAGAITQYQGRDVYYDWLGRPVLVLDAGGGDPVVAYAYDAFGRLARRTAPWPSDGDKQRIEEYHYDGVRRIQEIFTDPVAATPPWPQAIQPGGPLGGGGSTGDTVRTEAEYVWSAASGQPFDTCHVQIDWWDREAWFVQDHATGTVRAYTDASGEVVEQYGFDAFGNLIRRDAFALAQSGSLGYYHSFRQRLGHQGLFADRLDAHTAARVIEPGVEAWYQSRSRWYAPELGRFVTADPNGTGITIQSSLAKLGMLPVGPPHGSFEWDTHYGDGWDVFTAYRANPVQTRDPTGLFGFGSLLMAGLDMTERSLGAMDMAAFGVSQQMRVAELWTGYAMGQMAMVDALTDPHSTDPYLEAGDYGGGIMSAGSIGMVAVFAAEFDSRRHGGQTHNREINRITREQMATGKYSKALKNRGLVNSQGRTIFGGVRPDIQLIRADGSGVDIIEVDYTSKHDPRGTRAKIIRTVQAESGVRGSFRTWDIDVKTGRGRWR